MILGLLDAIRYVAVILWSVKIFFVNRSVEAVRDPLLTLKKAGYVTYYYLMHLLTKYTDFTVAGDTIWHREWDVLLILDACRYDVFDDLYESDSRFDIGSMRSAGSASPEWMFNNFDGTHAEEMADTAYVTGNPYSAECLGGEHFSHVEEVWRTHWDDEEGTVLPAVLSDEAIRVWETIDPERMIVHYMQPHKPYVPAPDSTKMETDDFTFNLIEVFASRALGTYPDFKKAEARRGTISDDELRRLYRENLKYVVESLDETILRSIDADIVISADHGELLGEGGVYHHPAYIRRTELREVPWVTVERPPDGQYTPTRRPENRDEARVDEKLADLGYR